jgi:hypothetical protein
MSLYQYKFLGVSKLLAVFVIFTLLSSSLLLFNTTTFAQISNSTANSVEILPRNSKPYGLSYEEHVKSYWKHTLLLNKTGHPWYDIDGSKCRVGQEKFNSSIFYLPTNGGDISNRTCKIRSGLGILIPIIVGESSLKESPEAKITDLPQIAKLDQDKMNHLELQINDKKFSEEEIRKYSVLTSPFNVIFAKDPLFAGKGGGPTVSAADGYYVLTAPLPKGTYMIHTHGDMCNNPLNCGPEDFTTTVNTKLIVE